MAHSYHEAFWIVVGAAAPVIGLAATVVESQLLSGFGTLDDKVERLLRKDKRRLLKAFATGFLFDGILTVIVIAQAIALYQALRSLSQGHDLTSHKWPELELIGGFVLLVIANHAPNASALQVRELERDSLRLGGDASELEADNPNDEP